MNKFLNKQFKGMLKREEQKLAEYNLGKIREERKTIDQFIKKDFAYTEPNEIIEVGQLESETQGGHISQYMQSDKEGSNYSHGYGSNSFGMDHSGYPQ